MRLLGLQAVIGQHRKVLQPRAVLHWPLAAPAALATDAEAFGVMKSLHAGERRVLAQVLLGEVAEDVLSTHRRVGHIRPPKVRLMVHD